MSAKLAKVRTTTVRLPKAVYEQARSVVEAQKISSGSFSLNDLFVQAITTYLRMHRRRQIDAAFAGMAEDDRYHKEANLLESQFQRSDWEALRLTEEELEEGPTHG